MADIVTVGYVCPECGDRVAVLSSNDKLKGVPEIMLSECWCGYVRVVTMLQLQSLEVWRAAS